MKKFDVYAVGNALVDVEYHASVERLTELGAEKGVMTLIDEQRQNGLMRQLGESHEKMTCGGSAANTIIALAQFGAVTHFDGRVSNDMAGQFYTRDLHDSGVHSSLESNPATPGVTGKCLVFVTPDADRTMNTFLGASADLDDSDISEEAIADSTTIYIEGYLASEHSTSHCRKLQNIFAPTCGAVENRGIHAEDLRSQHKLLSSSGPSSPKT